MAVDKKQRVKPKPYRVQERYADFHDTFDTPSGRRVLQYLYDTFMRSSAIRPSVEQTMVALGKQEAFRHIMMVLAYDDFKKFEEAVYARSFSDPPTEEPTEG